MALFRPPDPDIDIETAFKFMVRNQQDTDLQLIARDRSRTYNVHRLVASIHSYVFADILYPKDEAAEPPSFYQITNESNLALENMISYFYGENLTLRDVQDIRQTKAIADTFKIVQLGKICRERLTEIPVQLEDVLTVLETVIELGNKEKEEECYRLINTNQEVVFNSQQFLGLPFRQVLKIFQKLKSMGNMAESEFLLSTVKWMVKSKNCNCKNLLMENVDIERISLNDYVRIVITYSDFFSNVEIGAALGKIFRGSKTSEDEGAVARSEKAKKNVEEEKQWKKEIEKAVEEAKLLAKEVDECKVKNAKETEQWKKERELLTKQIDEYKEKNAAEEGQWEKDRKSLTKEIEEYKESLNQVLQKNEIDQETCDHLNKTVNQNTQKFQQFCKELEEKKLELETKNQKINELQETMTKLTEQNRQLTSTSQAQNAKEILPKTLTIEILKPEDGVNSFNLDKRARITVHDGYTSRSLQIAVTDALKTGLLGTVIDKKGSYTDKHVDISYEGVYFMTRSLHELAETLSPTQYVEVLKAALFFQMKDLGEKCIKKINGIVDFDPLFLDGLRELSYWNDKSLGLKGLSEFYNRCLFLLLSDPLKVILHPNMIICSEGLLILILQQDELKIKDETQLLLVIIGWLSAHPEKATVYRSILLKKLCFQSISTPDFKYVTIYYPNFFYDDEINRFMDFRNAVGSEVKSSREKLPEWYKFKLRKNDLK